MASALAGLATNPKVQASSTAKSAKVSFKQYKINKKYKNGVKANYYFNLPHLKGNQQPSKRSTKIYLSCTNLRLIKPQRVYFTAYSLM